MNVFRWDSSSSGFEVISLQTVFRDQYYLLFQTRYILSTYLRILFYFILFYTIPIAHMNHTYLSYLN